MGERKVIALFKRSPRPKWRELTGAMRSLTVARDFQKLAKKNVGSRIKAGRATNNSTTRSSSKTSSWMTSDEDDDDDDFAELSDFEIDEDECETPRFSDTISSCLSTDIFSNKAPKDWNEDPVPFLNFDSAIKSTPIEKQEPEVSSEIQNFEFGVVASSTPKSNKMKTLNMNESEPKLALELEGNILPMHQETPALDLKADLFDSSHEDVEIPEISMSEEKEVSFNNSKSPNIQSNLHQTICSASQNKSEVPNEGSDHNPKNISLSAIEKPSECAHSLKTSVEDVFLESMNETMCPIVQEQLAEPPSPDWHFDEIIKNIQEKDDTFNKSIFSFTSGRLDEAPQTADCSSSFNKTLVSVDEKGKKLQNVSMSMLTKLPKLGRKLAFRRNNHKKPTDFPKRIVIQSEEYDLKNIPVCCLVTPSPCAMEDLSVSVNKPS